MSQKYYSAERTTQIVISLLKQHGIKKIVASPGTGNVMLVGSMQQDPWFEMYSVVDERSAAYMACGLAAECGEPIVLSCTGATASRNYLPGLTEAYYRKLPVLAITASQDLSRIGHLSPQQLDRRSIQNDIAVCSEHLFPCRSNDDEWDCEIKVNRAILALTHRGGGPAHLNFTTTYSPDFSVPSLPQAKKISRYQQGDKFPEITFDKRVVIFVGAHNPMSESLTEAIDKFCATHDSVVFCDHTSGYRGKYRASMSLVGMQTEYSSPIFDVDILIHIGEISGDYPVMGKLKIKEGVWRVSEDGELKDYFKKLKYVFDMKEELFFGYYAKDNQNKVDYLNQCTSEYEKVLSNIPELPFSNLWVASKLAPMIPADSVLHLGILNSLRSWNVYSFDNSIRSFCNTGGFGIDGIISTCLGGALANPKRLHFCVIGDLAFFYDLNSIGSRHVMGNLRILLINNGKGTEFRNYTHPGAAFGEDADKFIAAGGHYGKQSPELVKHYAQDLGFKYLVASTKEELSKVAPEFVNTKDMEKPILLEIFTNSDEESDALKSVNTAVVEGMLQMKHAIKDTAKSILGNKLINSLKNIKK